jgi:hypothetical protein
MARAAQPNHFGFPLALGQLRLRERGYSAQNRHGESDVHTHGRFFGQGYAMSARGDWSQPSALPAGPAGPAAQQRGSKGCRDGR